MRASRLTALAFIAGVGAGGAGLACAGPRQTGGGPLSPTPAAGGTIPLSQALVLGTSGAAPHDTTVTFPAGERRTIVLRHAPPDNLIFATLDFPASTFAADSGHEITVQLHARPGVYGVGIETSAPIGPGATVTFSYPRYFLAPPESRQRYGSDVAFERALTVARLRPDSILELLPPARPAPDNLRASLPSAGTYLVAAAQ